MLKYTSVFLVLVFLFSCKPTEQKPTENTKVVQVDSTFSINNSPKLVVGVVVDQMRYDYLTRFWNQFGDGGFKRIIKDGFNCKNNHYNYVPTYTGPGHASIYTGTTPKNHGIISNNWYDKYHQEQVYCAGDENVNSVGTESNAGKMSPHRMLTTTFSDQNRLHTQFRGKTIGISIKDRGAILPGGHSANGAYWFQGRNEGNFISSTYYFENLPQWVQNFNDKNNAERYLTTWNTLKPIKTYVESGSDENDFERGFRGKDKATFPYDLKDLSSENGGYNILKSTAFGNSLVTDFALAAIDGEALGKDKITDVLAVSYSSTDYVGHNFGVNSKEIQDIYMRLDLELKRLLESLDEKVGEGNYTLFLTSDHGAVHVPNYLKSKKIPAGYLDNTALMDGLKDFLGKEYGMIDLIEDYSNSQLFFNKKRLAEENIKASDLALELKEYLIEQPHIAQVFTAEELLQANQADGVARLVENGFNQKRSGNLIVIPQASYISYPETGSTHGSSDNYDTHVPLLFYGNGIKQGSTIEKTEITDIAPTISALLGIAFPNGATGKVLSFVIEE